MLTKDTLMCGMYREETLQLVENESSKKHESVIGIW